MAVAQCSTDVVAVQQLKRLVQEWGQEMELLVQTLDSMTDPAIFINVTGRKWCVVWVCAHIYMQTLKH